MPDLPYDRQPTPEEFLAYLDGLSENARISVAEKVIENSEMAKQCFMKAHDYIEGHDRTQMVAEFMRAFGQDVPTQPTFVDDVTRVLRARLVMEETMEFLEAMGCIVLYEESATVFKPSALTAISAAPGFDQIDMVEAADALADLSVVVLGSELALGIPGAEVFREVHRSNMAKLGPDGKPILDQYRKVRKPDNWTPPQIASILEMAHYEQQQITTTESEKNND